MGRLYGSRCYLAGPMDRVADHGEGCRLRPGAARHRGNVERAARCRRYEYDVCRNEWHRAGGRVGGGTDRVRDRRR